MNRHAIVRRVAAWAFLAALAVVSVSCETTGIQAHADRYPEFRQMRAELAPLRFDQPSDTPTIREYYADASRGIPGVRHDTGTVPTLGMNVAVHVWYPPGAPDGTGGPRGTVFVVHGYLAHPLQHAALIRRLLQENFVVVAPELPGHALSDGPRGAIGDFADYGEFFNDVTAYVEGHVPKPWHAVGHSTGATTIYEFVRRFRDPFDAVVFVAPLVRSRYYGLARAGRFLTRPFLQTIDTGYDDPLGVEQMPLSWFDREVEWNRRADGFATVQRSILVLQGTADHVVAWRYNRRFLQKAFREVHYRLFDGAGHVLFREAPPVGPAAVEAAVSWILADGAP